MYTYQQWNKDFKRDFATAEVYMPEIIRIIKRESYRIISDTIAPKSADMHQSWDVKLTLPKSKYLIRVRRGDCKYRDFTIRTNSKRNLCELTKIRNGGGELYFYGWGDDGGGLIDWIIIDLDRLRASKLLDRQLTVRKNAGQDHTGFVYIHKKELTRHFCLISSKPKHSKGKTSPI